MKVNLVAQNCNLYSSRYRGVVDGVGPCTGPESLSVRSRNRSTHRGQMVEWYGWIDYVSIIVFIGGQGTSLLTWMVKVSGFYRYIEIIVRELLNVVNFTEGTDSRLLPASFHPDLLLSIVRFRSVTVNVNRNHQKNVIEVLGRVLESYIPFY